MDIKLNNTTSKSYKKEICRKSLHLSSLWMPILIYFVPKMYAAGVFAFILLADFCMEYGNYKKNKIAQKLFRIFSFILRKREMQKQKLTFTGSIYVLMSALICTLIFPKNIAVISLAVMLVSDTFAALVGKAFGMHKIYQNKSIEGSLAFFVSAVLIMFICRSLYPFSAVCVFACLIATLVELFENLIKIDDNLSIPLCIGAILSLL